MDSTNVPSDASKSSQQVTWRGNIDKNNNSISIFCSNYRFLVPELFKILLTAVLNHKVLLRVKSTSDRGDMEQGQATAGACFCCVSIIGWWELYTGYTVNHQRDVRQVKPLTAAVSLSALSPYPPSLGSLLCFECKHKFWTLEAVLSALRCWDQR